MADSLLTGLSALSAQQRAMEVTSHNLANATTPGYTRQRADLAAASPENVRPGQLGRGVDLQAVRRIADNLVNERLRQSEGEAGRLENLRNNLMVVQQAFNEPGDNGLSAVIGKVFSAFEDLSNNPESSAIRSTAVQAMQTFTSTMYDLGNRVTNIRNDLGISLQSDLSKINSISQSVALLNQQIRTQVNLGNSPNDLLDNRERLLAELTSYVDARVRINPTDLTATVDVGGRMLIGTDSAETLSARKSNSGMMAIVSSAGLAYDVTGGSVGALYELHNKLLPEISDVLDTLAGEVARGLNAINATGTNDAYFANAFVGEITVPTLEAGTNLDDSSVIKPELGQPGIPEVFLPDFTDGLGNLEAKDLTINVYNTTTKVAVKHVLRWDPAQANGSRSLDDLISAINTGVGGGFTLYPPTSNGVVGVNARRVQVDGGFRLELKANDPAVSIDFSQALDLQPSKSAWTGTGAVTATGTAAPAIPARRVSLTVNAAGTAVDVSYRDPTNGQTVALGSVAVPGVGVTNAVINGITVQVAAGTFRAGDSIALNLDATGAVIDPTTGSAGTHTVAATWSATDSVMAVRGRYTNTLSDPTLGWSAKVLTAGVVGAISTTAPPNNPPVVQFTYWTGTPEAPVQQVMTKTLDQTRPAGTPIELVDGVYVTFTAGNLSTVGNQLDFNVDGQPDQAGLLPALGINNLIQGGDSALTMAVADRLITDPTQLGLAKTRNEGDNSNITAMLQVRKEKLFNDGALSMEEFYSTMLTDVGVRIQQSERLGENQDALKASLTRMREQISGVSIDEEVGRLIQQQQAYSAAARIITTSRENIQTLMEIMG